MTVDARDLRPGDVVEAWYTGGPTPTVKRVRVYADTVVIWWTDLPKPSTVTKGQKFTRR